MGKEGEGEGSHYGREDGTCESTGLNEPIESY